MPAGCSVKRKKSVVCARAISGQRAIKRFSAPWGRHGLATHCHLPRPPTPNGTPHLPPRGRKRGSPFSNMASTSSTITQREPRTCSEAQQRRGQTRQGCEDLIQTCVDPGCRPPPCQLRAASLAWQPRRRLHPEAAAELGRPQALLDRRGCGGRAGRTCLHR